MKIIGNYEDCIINFNNVIDIYTADTDIVALLVPNDAHKKTVILATYQSSMNCKFAFRRFLQDVKAEKEVIQLIDDKLASSLSINLGAIEKSRASNGKKTKRRGGS